MLGAKKTPNRQNQTKPGPKQTKNPLTLLNKENTNQTKSLPSPQKRRPISNDRLATDSGGVS